MYGRLLIPEAVYDEVVVQEQGRWGATETAAASWIDRVSVQDRMKVAALLSHLNVGESEAIVLKQRGYVPP